jgi:hypothetical protein
VRPPPSRQDITQLPYVDPRPAAVRDLAAAQALDPPQTPARDPVPRPARDPLPTPALDPLPRPALDPLPTPARDPLPTPALDPLPTPPREVTGGPSFEPRPRPALDPLPTPARDALPTPALDPLPRPALDPLPTPALDPLPRPALDPLPTPARDPLPTPPRELTTQAPTSEPRPVTPPPPGQSVAPAQDLSSSDLIDLADRLAAALRQFKGDANLALWLFEHAGGQASAHAFTQQVERVQHNPASPREQALLVEQAPTAARLLEAAILLANVVSSLGTRTNAADNEVKPNATDLEPIARA